MSDSPSQPVFRVLPCLAVLAGAAIASAAFAAWLAPLLQAQRGVESGAVLVDVAATAAVVWGLYAAGVVMIAHASAQPTERVMAMARAWFIGMGIRALGAMVAGAIMIGAWAMDPVAVAVTLVSVYLVLLFVEAGFVGRSIWRRDVADAGPCQVENVA